MRSSTSWKGNILLWVLFLFLAALIVCPLISVFAKAVIIDGRLDFYQAWSIIADTENLQTVWNSLLLGVSVVLCSTLIAAPTAYLLARTDLRRHKWLDIIFMIPFMTPPYIASWAGSCSCRSGACFSSFFPLPDLSLRDFSLLLAWYW